MNTVQKGTLLEIEFAVACALKGAVVSTPIVPTHYDLLVDNGSQILKIQVKTATPGNDGSWRANGTRRVIRWSSPVSSCVSVPYKNGQVDHFVTRVDSCWYIIPAEMTCSTLTICPSSSRVGKYDQYRENWSVLGLPVEKQEEEEGVVPRKHRGVPDLSLIMR